MLKEKQRMSGPMADHHPDPVDIHVGRRLRLRRTLLGMSQEQLAHSVGVTFQQIQKYERGSNRVSASRLFDIARVLGVPVAFFFEDIGEDITADRLAQPGAKVEGLAEAEAGFEQDPLSRNETLELVRAYWRLNDPGIRRNILDLLKSLARRD